VTGWKLIWNLWRNYKIHEKLFPLPYFSLSFFLHSFILLIPSFIHSFIRFCSVFTLPCSFLYSYTVLNFLPSILFCFIIPFPEFFPFSIFFFLLFQSSLRLVNHSVFAVGNLRYYTTSHANRRVCFYVCGVGWSLHNTKNMHTEFNELSPSSFSKYWNIFSFILRLYFYISQKTGMRWYFVFFWPEQTQYLHQTSSSFGRRYLLFPQHVNEVGWCDSPLRSTNSTAMCGFVSTLRLILWIMHQGFSRHYHQTHGSSSLNGNPLLVF